MPEADSGIIEIAEPSLKPGSRKFARLPRIVRVWKTLSMGAKLTYATLVDYAWEEGSCYPGQERMAEEMGCSERAVRRYLHELQEQELVKVSRRGANLNNVYTLLPLPADPADWWAKADRPNLPVQLLDRPNLPLQEGDRPNCPVGQGVDRPNLPVVDRPNCPENKTHAQGDTVKTEGDTASAGHAREDGEGRKVDAGPPVVETSSEDLSSVTDATVRFVLTTVPGIPRTEAAITQVQLQCQAARHANPALPIRGETLLCVRYWAGKNETVQSWLRAWTRWMEGAVKRPNPEAAGLEAELPQETPSYDYPPSGVPFYDRLSAWCCWLADNANLPQRQPTDYEFMHLRPLSYDPVSGELRLSARYPEGAPERAGQPVYEYKREQWPSTFRKVAERHMNTKITVLWVESEVPV